MKHPEFNNHPRNISINLPCYIQMSVLVSYRDMYVCTFVRMYDVCYDVQIPCTRNVAINRLYLLPLETAKRFAGYHHP